MTLKKSRLNNKRLASFRTTAEYDYFMADLKLMGVITKEQYEKYTGHEWNDLLKEPEV